MKRTLLSLLFLGYCTLVSAQQATLKKAWDEFKANDRQKAAQLFEEATGDPATASEAHLMLSILCEFNDDDAGAFKNFQEYMKLNPGEDSYPYLSVLWYTSSVLNGSGKLAKDRLKFLNTLLADPNLPGTLKASVYGSLGDHYVGMGDFKKAKTYYDQIGSITTWALAGEFDNISASGFDKSYAPINEPSLDSKFKNNHGAEVQWFKIKDVRPNRWVDLETYFNASNTIVFAQNFVNSPSSQKVQFRLGVSGSVKLWLNDQLIFSEEEERNNGLDNYLVETTLNSGYNRILIQVGESEVNSSNFLLRITDEKGNNISGLTYSADPQPYKKGNAAFKSIEVATETYLKKKVETNKDNLLHLLMLAQYYRMADREYESRKTLTEAEKLAPESGFIKGRMVLVYSREGNRTGISKLIEWFKANEPRNEISLNLLYSEAMDQKNYKMADSVLQELADIKGENHEEVLLKKIGVYANQERIEELIKVVNDGYKMYPNNESFVRLQVLLQKQNQQPARAIAIMKKYTDANYSRYYLGELADLYIENNNATAAFGVYNKILKNNPIDIATIVDIANLHMSLRNYNQALEYASKAVEIAPYLSGYWDLRARCYEELGQPEQAEAEYKRSLELYPQDFDVRKKLRKLQGKEEDIFESFTKRDVYKLFKEAPKAEDYPEYNSIFLLDEVQRVVYKEGASEERRVLVVKVFNAAGIDDWKEYSLPIYRGIVEKVEVLKANGTKLNAERSGTEIVFTNLEPGDGIHIAYRTNDYNFGRLEPHFTDNFAYQSTIPILHDCYSLLIDPSVKFQYKFSKEGFEAQKKQVNNMDLYVWEKKNIPAYKLESFSPKRVDFVEVLHLSTMPDWTWVSNWYSDLARTKAKQDFEVKATAKEILADQAANLSELEKAKLIHKYIVTNIRYSQVPFRQSGLIPQKASRVINTRVGDCKDVATLFVALAKEMGIDSVQLVLILTRDRGTKNMLLPNIDFNHCIAMATIGGKPYYIELTTDKNGFTTHPVSLRGAFALVIYDENENRKSEPFYLNIPTRTPDNISRNSEAVIKDKNLTVNVNTVSTGDWASSIRYQYADISEEERKKKLINGLSSDNANIKLNSFKYNDLKTISDSVSYNYNYTLNNAVTQITTFNIFTIPWTDKLSSISFFSNEERNNPILIWDYLEFDKEEEIMTVTLPIGKTLAEVPKNVKYTSAIGTYEVTYQLKGNVLTAKRVFIITKDVLDANQYQEAKAFIEKVVAEDGKQIAIK